MAYLDDITDSGKTQEEHDVNLEGFLKAASTYNLEINQEKSKFSLRSLGYKICNGTLQPDPGAFETSFANASPFRHLILKKVSWYVCLLRQMDI